MNFFKRFFQLNRFRRLLILSLTTIVTIIGIVVGSVLYTSKTAKRGLDYGGGTEYLVQIEGNNNQRIDSNLATQIADSIYDRVNGLGTSGVVVESGENSEGATVRIQYPDLESEIEKKEIRSLIVAKPHLVFTDIYGNALFDEYGKFNKKLSIGNDPGRAITNPETFAYQKVDSKTQKPLGWRSYSKVPLATGKAESKINQSGSYEVEISLESEEASSEWTKVTSYVSSLPQGKNSILTWLDLDELISKAKSKWQVLWNESNGNIFNFVHVNNDPNAVLREKTINASDYLISQASVGESLHGRNFVISGSGFNRLNTLELAKKINFGTSDYRLNFLRMSQIDSFYGQTAFNKAIIAGIIVFAIIALFLIANYGLLGVISTVSISLYMFLTLTLFNLMQGEYSPETIASLVIGIGMSVDANIITFEKLKNEIYQKSSLKKAYKLSNSRSFTTIFDANITTLIVAFVLFFFGTRAVVGLSVMLIISIFFTLLVMLGFTRILTSLLIGTNLFENKKSLLGIRPKIDQNIQKKIEKVDYVKQSKYFSAGSLSIMAIAILVFIITAAVGNSIVSGFVLSKEFKSGTDIIIESSIDNTILNDPESISKQLIEAGVKSKDIVLVNSGQDVMQMKANIGYEVDLSKINDIQNASVQVTANSVSNHVARQLVQNALIAISIAILLVIGYTLIRFKWTYSLSAIVALVHDALIVLSVFVIFRLTISPVFVAAILSTIGYSINDTIVTFDQIRSKMKNVNRDNLDKKQINSIANQAIKDTLKRSLLTSITTMVSIVVLMSFGNATRINFNIAMLSGILVGTYSSIFIATFIWTKLEIFSLKRQKARIKNNFWTTKGIEEQTFKKINDFNQ